MLEHGGNLMVAAQKFGIPLAEWLDLSTGINPQGYPVSAIPPEAWLRLPQSDDRLALAAARYYGNPANLPLPTAGSQAALQTLPRLRAPCRVAITLPTYAEHPRAWTSASHQLSRFAPADVALQIDTHDVVILCHPNNPTGQRYQRDELLAWHAALARRNGWLVVDEAFLDGEPEASLTPFTGQPGLVVLRSLGKFFGMAGARVGFVFAWPQLLAEAQEWLGPWGVNGPARHAAIQALEDRVWQARTRDRLQQDSARLVQLLTQYGLPPSGGTNLFQWVCTPLAQEIHRALAERGILVRLFDQPASVRFGLPGDETAWQRLVTALESFSD